MIFKYTAPTLTKYGKVTEFIEAGSLAVGDVTGDGVADTLFDTNDDGIGDLVVGGANGGETPVSLVSSGFDGFIYDADGDGLAGIFQRETNLVPIVSGTSTIIEPAADDGWDDPARD